MSAVPVTDAAPGRGPLRDTPRAIRRRKGVRQMMLSADAMAQEGGGELRSLYLESLRLLERVHRHLLFVIRDEFDRLRHEIGCADARLLFNIGDATVTFSAAQARNHHLGSNVAHALRKLVERGYVARSEGTGRRSTEISLTPKGRDVAEVVNRLYERHVRSLVQVGQLTAEDFHAVRASLRRLDQILNQQSLLRR